MSTIEQLANDLNKVERAGVMFRALPAHGGAEDENGEHSEGLITMQRSSAEALLRYWSGTQALPFPPDLRGRHDLAEAREVTYAAGYPLRDRYGYAVDDQQVQTVIQFVKESDTPEEAIERIGIACGLGDLRLASGHGAPSTEEYEAGIVKALWALRK